MLDKSQGTSITLNENLPVGVSNATISSDEKGNPLIFGGIFS